MNNLFAISVLMFLLVLAYGCARVVARGYGVILP